MHHLRHRQHSYLIEHIQKSLYTFKILKLYDKFIKLEKKIVKDRYLPAAAEPPKHNVTICNQRF